MLQLCSRLKRPQYILHSKFAREHEAELQAAERQCLINCPINQRRYRNFLRGQNHDRLPPLLPRCLMHIRCQFLINDPIINDSRVTYFPLIEMESTRPIIKRKFIRRRVICDVESRFPFQQKSIILSDYPSLSSTLTAFTVIREYTQRVRISSRKSPVNSPVNFRFPLPLGRLLLLFGDPSPQLRFDSFLRQNDRTVWAESAKYISWRDVPGRHRYFFLSFLFLLLRAHILTAARFSRSSR